MSVDKYRYMVSSVVRTPDGVKCALFYGPWKYMGGAFVPTDPEKPVVFDRGRPPGFPRSKVAIREWMERMIGEWKNPFEMED